jgi:hypothetical protein
MTDTPQYATDRNKLYNVMGIARWGISDPTGLISFESLDLAGGDHIAFTSKVEYPILFDVSKMNRYPSAKEWAKWNSSVFKHAVTQEDEKYFNK